MSGFLTKANIRFLTGLEDKAEQVAWLRTHGVHHFVNAAGKIVVTWGAVEGRSATDRPASWSPDFSSLGRA